MLHHITLAGAGLMGVHQMSREVQDAVRAARIVFYSNYNAGMTEHLRALAPEAQLHCSEEGEYRVGMFRPEMYERMAARVLDAAREGPGVVMLGPGSAVVVDLVTQCVLEGARAAGFGVRVLPAISSIESVLAQLHYDVSDGLQVVLAQKLVLARISLQPSIAALVIQPAYFDTLHFAGAPRSRSGRFDRLQAQLMETWSAEAPMALVIAPTDPGAEASVLWFRLGQMSRIHRALSPRHTLFVPAERDPTSDAGFEARIRSWEELMTHVELDERGAPKQQRRRDAVQGVHDVPDDLLAESEELAARWSARSLAAAPPQPRMPSG